MELLKDFGFDPILLTAQIINFLIVLVVLKKFMYKPVLDMLKKRENDIKKGIKPQHFKKTLIISNRQEAINAAVSFAQKGDIILLAGKGHENYQEIMGVKTHFDDIEILNSAFKKS